MKAVVQFIKNGTIEQKFPKVDLSPNMLIGHTENGTRVWIPWTAILAVTEIKE